CQGFATMGERSGMATSGCWRSRQRVEKTCGRFPPYGGVRGCCRGGFGGTSFSVLGMGVVDAWKRPAVVFHPTGAREAGVGAVLADVGGSSARMPAPGRARCRLRGCPVLVGWKTAKRFPPSDPVLSTSRCTLTPAAPAPGGRV